MEGARIGRTIAEVGRDDAPLLQVLARESQTRGERQVAADDRVAAPQVPRHVGQVHRPTLALAHARGLTKQLGHERPQRHATGDGIPVVTVVGDDVVAALERRDGANGHSLFANVEVQEATDLAQRVVLK